MTNPPLTAPLTVERRRFATPRREVADLLRSLADYGGEPDWPRDHRALADSLSAAEPCSLLLFSEPLAGQHWRRKTHTHMARVELVSELDEAVLRHFYEQINSRMAKELEIRGGPGDDQYRALVREYRPQARIMLRESYREIYPRAWRRRWATRAWSKPRVKIECRRRYDLPAPLGSWETGAFQQFYLMRRSRTYARGCASGSGSREVHSYFGLAFLELARRGVDIPSHILVYDRHNKLRLVETLPGFVIHPGSMGSNCEEPAATVRDLMRTALTARAIDEPDWSGIRAIEIGATDHGLVADLGFEGTDVQPLRALQDRVLASSPRFRARGGLTRGELHDRAPR
ncbi:MAG: hypothetical protein AB1806_11720 [Acidobacteriota bacterium]